ncbi:ribonuclease HII [Candidatus Giovannonibacteria bacterium]|nr:ribonuclease HII [Candidatus Giovannonibacteria bacterium]
MSKYIVGIDEVGRGPLAGPVTVAAVAAPISNFQFLISNEIKGIKDSKKLSPKKRDDWYKKIKKNNKFRYSVSSVSHSVIDKKGIVYALRLAVKRCVSKLEISNSDLEILLDGSLYAPPEYKQKTIIRGDETVPIISAASIIAKVTRDRKMTQLAKKYPKYLFDIHKGYGTKLHRELLKTNGFCDIHRKSFCTRVV